MSLVVKTGLVIFFLVHEEWERQKKKNQKIKQNKQLFYWEREREGERKKERD